MRAEGALCNNFVKYLEFNQMRRPPSRPPEHKPQNPKSKTGNGHQSNTFTNSNPINITKPSRPPQLNPSSGSTSGSTTPPSYIQSHRGLCRNTRRPELLHAQSRVQNHDSTSLILEGISELVQGERYIVHNSSSASRSVGRGSELEFGLARV